MPKRKKSQLSRHLRNHRARKRNRIRKSAQSCENPDPETLDLDTLENEDSPSTSSRRIKIINDGKNTSMIQGEVTVLMGEVEFQCDADLLAEHTGVFKPHVLGQESIWCHKNKNNQTIIELKKPAKFSVSTIILILNDYLRTKELELTNENVVEIEVVATYLDIPELKEKCHQFITLHAKHLPGYLLQNNLDKIRDPSRIKPRFQCQFCSKRFNCKSFLNMHTYYHTGQKPYKCQVCHKSFFEKSSLKKHILVHSKEKPSIAPKKYLKKTHPMTMHSGQKSFCCQTCKQLFSNKEDLRTHTLTVHSVEKPLQCQICKMTFAKKGNLVIHTLTIHGDQKPFQCTICHKTFSDNSNLKTHSMIAHTDPKHSQSQKTLASESQLNKEQVPSLQTTQGLKPPFLCQLCHKGFYLESLLNEHTLSQHKQLPILSQMTQSDQKPPFQCQFCPIAFFLESLLNKHTRSQHNQLPILSQTTQSDQKPPFQCQFCPIAFFLESLLNEHTRSYHSKFQCQEPIPSQTTPSDQKPPFQCQVCPKAFFS